MCGNGACRLDSAFGRNDALTRIAMLRPFFIWYAAQYSSSLDASVIDTAFMSISACAVIQSAFKITRSVSMAITTHIEQPPRGDLSRSAQGFSHLLR